MMTQAEILENFGWTGRSPARVVVEFSNLELDEAKCAVLFQQFAGAAAPLPPNRLLPTVVAYLVYDAAAGKPLDVAGCVERAERLAIANPYNFSDAAEAERAAAKAALRAEREAKAAKKASEPPPPREVVNEDGTITRRRGRPPAGVESVYDKVKALYAAAADKSKEAMLPMLQEKLGIGAGTAQTYWYKAKKEVRV